MSAEFVAKEFPNTNFSSPRKYIWSHIRCQPLFAFVMIIGSFGNAAMASVVPIFAGRAIDRVQDGDGVAFAGYIALAIVGTQIFRSGVQYMRNASSEIFAQRIERDIRDELYVSLLGKSMTFHDFQPVGEIMARVTNDVREVNFMMNPGFNLIIGSGMFVLLPLLVAPTIHPALALTPLLFTLAYIVVQYRYILALHVVAQEVRKSFGDMNARLAETLEGIEVVKGSATEDYEVSQFNSLVDTVRNWFVRQGDIEARYLAILLLGLTLAGGFLHSIYLYDAGEIAIGDIVAFMGQIALYGFPVFTSIFSFSRVASGLAGAERILGIINTETDLDQNTMGHSGTIMGNIRFENVDFSYVDRQQVLFNVSFEIEGGQTVAIVGQTGSGKTTLTKLINRTYDTDSGKVLVDGINVRDWQLQSLRSQISIIEQEIFLFSRTIAENIAFGRSDASQEEIELAARRAQAHNFILSFSEGYDTVIGQRGVTLSGGQRQRIAIARAFLSDPEILILDDSTSAIDSATEDQIQKAIWEVAEGRTTILITHRLSQVRWADKILLIKKGRIIAQGTHDDLLKHSDAYRKIFARFED
ncbi:MAG: ABC transporter ATP-binding protein/permease [Chloroflexi bacterium]|nr:ABC transporter ATP-binding protein/permease [Chloroflexota bacterium]